MNDRSRRVVLLIDYDNLQICASRDTPGRDLQLTPVVQLAQRYGTVILARAYAEWNLSTERLAVYKAGIEPAFAPVLRTESDRSGKSLADTVMVAEGMDMLWTLSPDVVVLATSDKDLIPLVRVAKQRGAFVVVLGSDFTAIPLREMADEHITYRQLVTEATGRVATEAGAGRQPAAPAALPEPTRRRARERNGRERATTRPASTAASGQQRVEREPPAPTPAAAEPVAPVTAGAAAEADMQTGGRRRRRRGSRRRSDRLGSTSEFSSAGPIDGEPGDDEDEEITPTTRAVDIARASDATVELPPIEAVEAESAPPEAVEAAEPAPRATRRRRTRRTTGATEGEVPPAEPEIVSEPSPAPTPESSTVPEPSADVLPAPSPEPSADVLPAPTPETSSTNGEEPKPARATRPRRVASATRGRVRRG